MAGAPTDQDRRVQVALAEENTGNQHQRRLAIVERGLDALLRSALGEEGELGQAI